MPIQRWRCPAVLRIKSAVIAAAGVAVSLVFFPLWFALPVAVALAAWGLAMGVRGASVSVDSGASVLVLRMGLITRRVRLADVTAVLADKSKVSIARTGRGAISLYAWRKSRLDGWLRVPAITSDVGHAIAGAVAVARGAEAGEIRDRDEPPVRAGASPRSRPALATALLGCAGLLAVGAALLVRLSWHNPVLTALGVILALTLGVSGLFYMLFSLWLVREDRR